MGPLFEEVQLVKRDLVNLLFTFWLKKTIKVQPWCFVDTHKFFTFAMQQGVRQQLRAKYGDDVVSKHANQLIPIINLFSLTSGGQVPALDAFMGGLLS